VAKSSRRKKDGPASVAVLVDREYEDIEVWYPSLRFQEMGCQVTVVGCGPRPTFLSQHQYPIKADRNVEDISPRDFDAVIIPGGWAPHYLRGIEPVLELVRSMDAGGRVVAAIAEGGWVLCSSGVLRGRSVTGARAIRDDMKNAGCKWVDNDVVVDKNLITASKTRDLPGFCKAISVALELG
jgi:protease I